MLRFKTKAQTQWIHQYGTTNGPKKFVLKKIFLLSSILLLFFYSCKKKETLTEVRGTVIDAITLAPIPNASIQLLEGNCQTCAMTVIASGTCDGNGVFVFNTNVKEGLDHTTTAAKNLYQNNPGISFVQLKVGQSNNISVQLMPKSWYKIHIKNTSPYDANDDIEVGGYVTGLPIHYHGMNVDTTFIGLSSVSNVYLMPSWTIIKNNITTQSNGQIHCTSFDTTLFNINY